MSYQTTLSWSLVSSGIVTIVLVFLPYPSFYWGIGLLAAGILLFAARRVS